MKNQLIIVLLLLAGPAFAQKTDSSILVGSKIITLSELVVNNKLNVPAFIERIKNDSTFYKAFRNLHIIGFTAINDIRMNNKDGTPKATLRSKTKQIRANNCRTMQTLEETVTGDMYDDNRQFNYYTAQMYASLFFTKDSICNEDNIVTGREFSTKGKKGLEKNKEQLKMLFLTPVNELAVCLLSAIKRLFMMTTWPIDMTCILMPYYTTTKAVLFSLKK